MTMPVRLVPYAIRATAAAVCSGARCAYRSVMVMVLCPSNSRTVFKSTPAMTNLLAKWCRRSCQRKCLMPASCSRFIQAFFTLVRRSPNLPANTSSESLPFVSAIASLPRPLHHSVGFVGFCHSSNSCQQRSDCGVQGQYQTSAN